MMWSRCWKNTQTTKKYKHTQWFTIYVVAEDIFQVQYSENSVKTEGKQKTTRYSQKLQTKKLQKNERLYTQNKKKEKMNKEKSKKRERK